MTPLTDAEMTKLAEFIKESYGIDLTKKRELVVSRMTAYIESLGFASYTAYLDAVRRDTSGELRQRMIDRLSTNHTFFYREMNGINHFCDVAVPMLVASGVRSVKIWSCASSSGQECYAIAMELQQRIDAGSGLENFSIYASDINAEVIEKARLGRYPLCDITQIPALRAERYCKIGADTFSFLPVIRSRITWGTRNLMKPFDAIGRFDAVFCRNVMFYFDKPTRNELVNRLCAVVKLGGFLYIGMTETIDTGNKSFEYVSPSVYRKAKN